MKDSILFVITITVCLLFVEAFMEIMRPVPFGGAGTPFTDKAKTYGWALPPNKSIRMTVEGEKTFNIRTNGEGWKDIDHLDKQPGILRIMFVGDSYTFGWTENGKEYTRLTEALLHDAGYKNVEVISIGVGAWGTDQALEAMRVEGPEYRPDIIIYQFCENDIPGNWQPRQGLDETNIRWKKPFRYELDGPKLRRIDLTPRISWTDYLKHYAFKSALLYNVYVAASETGRTKPGNGGAPSGHCDVDPARYYHLGEVGLPDVEDQWKLFEGLIEEMNRRATEMGAQFAIFSESGDPAKRLWLLAKGCFVSDDKGDYVLVQERRVDLDFFRPLKRVKQIAKKAGVPVVEAERSYPRYANNVHTNEIGNENMAKDIVSFLIKSGWLIRSAD